MTDRTFFQSALTCWHHLDQAAVDPDDILRAAATRSYCPGLAVRVAPPDVLLGLLLRVKGVGK